MGVGIDWPPWWEWELELTPHLLKRMLDRRFTEVELREMLETATGYRTDLLEGRYVTPVIVGSGGTSSSSRTRLRNAWL